MIYLHTKYYIQFFISTFSDSQINANKVVVAMLY
jgi:hypothetical protein